MPKRGSKKAFAIKGEKDCWHPYSLQPLSPKRFAVVVGKILRGKYELISSRDDTGMRQVRII